MVCSLLYERIQVCNMQYIYTARKLCCVRKIVRLHLLHDQYIPFYLAYMLNT